MFRIACDIIIEYLRVYTVHNVLEEIIERK